MFKANRSEQRIEQLLDENNGVLIASDAIGSGIPRNAVYDFARSRWLEKASLGIFVDADVFPDVLYLLQARYPKVALSHETALYLHDMIKHPYDQPGELLIKMVHIALKILESN